MIGRKTKTAALVSVVVTGTSAAQPIGGYPMAGFILWEGASKRDAKPIVAIATGFGRKSANAKTGSMIQTWILRSRIDPVRALYRGADESICGTCALRGRNGRGRTCYVRINHAPHAIYHAYRRGTYPRVAPARATELCAGRLVRG